MKTIKLITHLLILFSVTSIYAQNNWCASDDVLKKQLLQNPEWEKQRNEYENGFKEYQAQNQFREKSNFPNKLIIPVVVHVIHEGGSENISKAQIQDMIRVLNEDYNRKNADTVNTPIPWRPIAGHLNVEFRLAKLDPLGNCTEGINRVYSNKTNNASDENGMKALSYWNAYSYFNIWVVKSIGLGANILGYAQFPATGLLSTDGFVILHNEVGTIGTASGQKGRTASHEAGHWFNLYHTWGDDDCGSDQVNDTPAQFGPNFGICYDDFPYFPADTCDNTNPYGEMMVNYMNYSDDQCMNMLTIGQTERMRYVFEGNSGTNGIRYSVMKEENLMATGTSDNFTGQPCAPIADFIANKTFACTGTTINFDDNSYNGSVTSRAWSFPGGDPATSSAATQNVTYANPGAYPVTLEVSNANGSDTETRTSYIHISGNTSEQTAAYTYFEDFESEEQFNNNWVIINPDNNIRKWEIAGGLSTPSGGGVLRVRNLGNTTTEYEEAISPSYNLSNLQSPLILKYNYSGATTTNLGDHENFTVEGDALKVFYSTNCGQSWTQIPQLALSDDNLINAGLYSSFYVPDQVSIWNEKQVTLPAGAANSDNVRFKFRYEVGSGFGNNFYVDAIRIENVTGVEELDMLSGIVVYPNPVENTLNITLNNSNLNSITEIQVSNILGEKILLMQNLNQFAYTINTAGYSSGVYLIQIKSGNNYFQQKFIKQ
jgi:hypothetical protein